MGCANAKPEVHTKKSQLNSNSNLNPSQISQPIQNQNLKSQPISTGKENIVPIQQQNINVQNPKSTLADIQKNPYLTREQVKQQIPAKQQQFKHSYEQKQNQKVTSSPPVMANNIEKQKIPQVEKQKPLQAQKLTSPQIEVHSTGSPAKQTLLKSDEKPHILSTIKQGRQQSEFTKQIEISHLGVEKKDDLRISNSIFSSNGTPRMDDNCMVSKISRPTQVPLKLIAEQEKGLSSSDVKPKSKVWGFRHEEDQKINDPATPKQQSSGLKENKQSEFSKKLHAENSNISKQSNKNEEEKGSSLIVKQGNQITTDEIKVNVLSEKESGQKQSDDDELIIPTEQNFDLGCSFEINNLIIDMNKLVW